MYVGLNCLKNLCLSLVSGVPHFFLGLHPCAGGYESSEGWVRIVHTRLTVVVYTHRVSNVVIVLRHRGAAN